MTMTIFMEFSRVLDASNDVEGKNIFFADKGAAQRKMRHFCGT
jgi:hypothetical protein